MAGVADAHPDAVVEVWAMDEARVGLIPSYRATWAPRGHRPTASSRRRYQWRYLYAFVHPADGEMVNVIGTTVGTEAFSKVLAEFAAVTKAGVDRRIVLVMDGAGWHTSKALVVPEGLHPVVLPPYSPELQPAERLFPLVNEAIANREHASLEQLETRLIERLDALDRDRAVVAAVTQFHWWPSDRQRASERAAS